MISRILKPVIAEKMAKKNYRAHNATANNETIFILANQFLPAEMIYQRKDKWLQYIRHPAKL